MLTLPSTIEVGRLDTERPEYSLYRGVWEELGILNQGGALLRARSDRFLTKRPKEKHDVYQERCKSIVGQTVLGTMNGWYEAKLFRQAPEIDIKGGDWTEWLSDCDNGGTPFPDFYRKVFLSMVLQRGAFILTDLPSMDEPVDSRAEEMEQGLDRPYLVLYEPISVPNWECDEHGNLEWVVIRIDDYASTSPFTQERLERRWYYFDRQQFGVYIWEAPLSSAGNPLQEPNEKNIANLVASGEHFLAGDRRVPVQYVNVPESLWLGNRAYLQLLDHLNMENTFSWALKMANLPILKIRGPFENQSVTLSEVDALHLPDPTCDAEWLEPAGTSFQFSADRIGYLREELYRSYYLQAQGRSSAATPAMQSGYSKELDLAPANDVLNEFGDILRLTQQRQLADVAVARGLGKIKISVRGYRFDMNSPIQELAVAQLVKDYGINSPTLEREMDKRVARSVLEDSPPEMQKAVESEIESLPTASEKEAQMMQDQAASFEQGFKKVTQKRDRATLTSAA